jgi:hypothetical protein
VIKVTREPDGLDFVEACVKCRKLTRYWANAGEYPLCQKCAATTNDKEADDG